ncbi:hypothetical protein KAM260_02320 [Klebsiella pneumoniae]|nr:hypothetical protein KAM260_02320 [Klebsiella pneumoniae]
MSNLQDSPVWVDGIYQLTDETPVLGKQDGVSGDGPANLQAQQLANRTRFLYELLLVLQQMAYASTQLYPDDATALASTQSGDYYRLLNDEGNDYTYSIFQNNSGQALFVTYDTLNTGVITRLEELILLNVNDIMQTGASTPLEGFPDVAWAWIDKEGKSTSETLSDGTTNLAALLLGNKIELVADDNDGITCQLRGTTTPLFCLSASGVVTFGDIRMFVSNEAFLAGYKRTWMDSIGNIYKVEYPDGSIEDATAEPDVPTSDTSTFPMVASVDDNIIAVQDDTVTQITNDTGVSNIAPVAYADFTRYLSNISGNYLTYRSSYNGKLRAREALRYLIHVIITGQSLAEGGAYNSPGPVTTAAQADYGIVCFSTGSNVDFNSQTLNPELLESVIPCRENVGVHPSNETPGSGIGWQIHERTGHTVLISNAGASGTAIAGISAGTPAFDGATKMIQAAVAMADELGMEYVPVMVLIHGNANAAIGTSVASYRTAMENLRLQYQSVINNASGGEYSLPMFLGQLSNVMPYGGTAGTTKSNTIGIAQYQEARDNEFIHLASAQYARPYSDGEHLTSIGYRTEGEVIGSVIGGWINDNSKSSLVPVETGVVQSGNTITIPVKGCVGDLVIDTARVADPGNYGFLIKGASIASVAVSGSGASAQIVITKTDSTPATRVSYAETGIAGQGPGAVNGSRGCIRDSQAGVSLSGLPLYNDLAVFAFTL